MTRVFRPLFTRTNRAANLTIVLLLSFGLSAAALLSAALDSRQAGALRKMA